MRLVRIQRYAILPKTIRVLCLSTAIALSLTFAYSCQGQGHTESPTFAPTTLSVNPESAALPFDIPDRATLNGRKVFGHYFPPYPVSIDNATPNSDFYTTQYMTVHGENNAHVNSAGFIRDRPAPRPPIADPQWRQRDLETEVRQAVAAGLDGFSVDIMAKATDTSWWGSIIPGALMQAAATVDPNFKVMLMPDMSASFNNMTPAELAAEMAPYATKPSVFKLGDGRLVISPFLAEAKSPTWWSQFITLMSQSYGINVALVPVFLDAAANRNAFASISYGMSSWGNRNPAGNPVVNSPNTPLDLAAAAHALGKIWMQSVSFQDVRPNQAIYDEAENTQNLRNTWQIALDSGSEWVQLTTWNDYSEGTSFAPSAGHGRSLLDINAYGLYWFRSGVMPTIVRDTAYLSYRTQKVSAVPANPSTPPMSLRQWSSPARDTVEVLTFLTAPAVVKVTVGSTTTTCNAPAGMSSCIAPLKVGSIKASVVRGTTEVSRVSSHAAVTATPYNQNLEYLVDSSRR
ncbi:glycoside hydrolase family 71 protein [Rhodococcus qingshengii]|uniref:glycoside hydrolase family 71 protein n=1 Tax=Rhodococcus qingshengii TaxID=334542 RepID=UPI00311CCCCC